MAGEGPARPLGRRGRTAMGGVGVFGMWPYKAGRFLSFLFQLFFLGVRNEVFS